MGTSALALSPGRALTVSSLRAITRYPSNLISRNQSGPDGGPLGQRWLADDRGRLSGRRDAGRSLPLKHNAMRMRPSHANRSNRDGWIILVVVVPWAILHVCGLTGRVWIGRETRQSILDPCAVERRSFDGFRDRSFETHSSPLKHEGNA